MLSLCRSDSVGSSNGSGGACTNGIFNHANSFGRDCVAWVQSRLCCCLKRSDPDTNTAVERRSLRQLEANVKPHFSHAARAAPDISSFEQGHGERVKNQYLLADSRSDLSSIGAGDIEEKPGGLELLEGVWGVGEVYRDDGDALWRCFGLRKEKELGEGYYGTVYKYLDNQNTAYAVKIHRQVSGEKTLVCHEYNNGNCYTDFKEHRGELVGLALPSHPNVAKIHACIMQDINSGKYIPIHSREDISEDDYQSVQLKIIISEFVDGVELRELLSKRKSFEQTPAGGGVTGKGACLTVFRDFRVFAYRQ